MPLILAIEPDPRQAAHLAAVLEQRPRTTLVIAGSASPALDALGDRIPHVVLTSPLIAPQDEMALAAWMAALGPAADGIQALTIPILSTEPAPAPPKRGVLARLRRRRVTAAASGCVPSAFVERIGVYLENTSGDLPQVEEPEPLVEPPEGGPHDTRTGRLQPAQPLWLTPRPRAFTERLEALRSPADRLFVLSLPALAFTTARIKADLVYLENRDLPQVEEPEPLVEPPEGGPHDTRTGRLQPAQPLWLTPRPRAFTERLEALRSPADRLFVLSLPALAFTTARIKADLVYLENRDLPQVEEPEPLVEPPEGGPHDTRTGRLQPAQPLWLTPRPRAFTERLEALRSPADRLFVLSLPALAFTTARIRADLVYLENGDLSQVDEPEPLVEPPEGGPHDTRGGRLQPAQPLWLTPRPRAFTERLEALRSPADRLFVLSLPALAFTTARIKGDLEAWQLQRLMQPIAAPTVTVTVAPPRRDETWVSVPLEDLAAPTTIRITRPAPSRLKAAATRGAKKRTPKPIQDEWGLFDPSQCGFSALIAKLDEIAQHEDAREAGPKTIVRVIAH